MSADALGRFAAAAAALEGVVRTSLGPHGAHKVLTSAAGRVLVTKSGGAMLDAVGAAGSAPMRVVLDAARAHGRACGDGTASFVLMLAEALRRIDACVRAAALGAATRPRLVGALARVAARWLPERALPALRGEAGARAGAEAGTAPGAALACTREAARALLATALSGQFGEAACAQLARMVAEAWARSGGGEGGAPAALPLVGVPGAPLEQSVLLEGLVLEGALASAQMGAELRGAPFAVLAFALGAPAAPASAPAAVRVGSGGAYAALLERADARADELVSELAAHGVRLLLCTEQPTAAAVASCVARGVSAAGCVDPSAARLLCAATRSAPLRDGSSVAALRAALLAAHPLPRASLRRADAAGRRLLVLSPQPPAHAPLFTLLLRAPTDGLALELARTAQRCWRMLRHAWASRPRGAAAAGSPPATVPCGGSFEFGLAALALADARAIERSAEAAEGGAAAAALACALRLLAEAALAPAHALCENGEQEGAERRWPLVRAARLATCAAGGGGAAWCVPRAVDGAGVEALEGRARLLSGVVELALQLSRVDVLVRARRGAHAERMGGGGGGGASEGSAGASSSSDSSSDEGCDSSARTMARRAPGAARLARRPRWFS